MQLILLLSFAILIIRKPNEIVLIGNPTHGMEKLYLKVLNERQIDMAENKIIKEQFTELLNEYYNGSFAQMVCEYIRLSGMSAKEVEEVLEELKKEKGA